MAMARDPFEGLSDNAKKVLTLIVRQHVTDGSSLIKHLGHAQQDVVLESLRQLESRDLVEVAGALTVEELPFTKFGVPPSVKGYLDQMLKYMR